LPDGKVRCGYLNGQDGGDAQFCDLKKEQCILCEETGLHGSWWDDTWVMEVSRQVTSRVFFVYHCHGKNASLPEKCNSAPYGGISGESYRDYFFGVFDSDVKKEKSCVVANYLLKYSKCYGCAVVETLTAAFMRAGSHAYEVSRQAGNVILLVGMMIWLAVFALQNVSSFATVEPMQLLQQFFVQCFKVVLAMIILNSGLQSILHYTLVPIISFGTDFATTISSNVSDAMLKNSLSSDNWASYYSREEGGGGQTSVGGGDGYSGGGSGGGSR